MHRHEISWQRKRRQTFAAAHMPNVDTVCTIEAGRKPTSIRRERERQDGMPISDEGFEEGCTSRAESGSIG